jgi:multicomponent Na+:H+ antiporter subunit D
MVDSKLALKACMAVAVAQMAISGTAVAATLGGSKLISAEINLISIDLFSAVVLFIIGMILLVTSIVAHATLKAEHFNFGNVLLLLSLGMNGIAMSTDLFSMYVFIEVTSASSFILIAINKKRDELEGAFKYYLLSAIATVMMLISVALLFALAGGTSFEAVGAYISGSERSPIASVAMILLTAALMIKSGAVPFHTWVPDAHSSAPSPVSVVLAGVVIKVSGAYAAMRIFRDVFMNDPALGNAMMILGLTSIIVGALGALGQSDIKRMLAFSSVSQIGYILMGAATGSPIGFFGAVMHFFNHATFKSLLFTDAAAILTKTGTRDMNKMGGLAQKMPVTGTSSILALLSMAGVPPLSGFWSKLMVIIAVWQVSVPLAVAALIASAFTMGYFMVIQQKVFFGKPAPGMENVTECRELTFVEVLLSALNVCVGLIFPLLLTYLHGAGLI